MRICSSVIVIAKRWKATLSKSCGRCSNCNLCPPAASYISVNTTGPVLLVAFVKGVCTPVC